MRLYRATKLLADKIAWDFRNTLFFSNPSPRVYVWAQPIADIRRENPGYIEINPLVGLP